LLIIASASNPLIELVVGPNHVRFYVLKSLLSHYLPQITPRDNTTVVPLPNLDSEAFRHVIDHLQDLDLGCTNNHFESDHHFNRWIKLFKLSQQLGLGMLAEQAAKQYEVCLEDLGEAPSLGDIQEIYNSSPRGSRMRLAAITAAQEYFAMVNSDWKGWAVTVLGQHADFQREYWEAYEPTRQSILNDFR
jgi:hypothetical protein